MALIAWLTDEGAAVVVEMVGAVSGATGVPPVGPAGLVRSGDAADASLVSVAMEATASVQTTANPKTRMETV